MSRIGFDVLLGRTIIRWRGCELALLPGEDGSPSIWTTPSIPYRQFFELEVICACGSKFCIESDIDFDGYFEVKIKPKIKELEIYEPTESDFVRVLDLPQLQTGVVDSIETLLDEFGKIVKLKFEVDNEFFFLESGCITVEEDSLKIRKPEDFILIGVN